MLCLSRSRGEQIEIVNRTTGKVVATITGLSPKCRIGIDAGPEIKILRTELKKNRGQGANDANST